MMTFHRVPNIGANLQAYALNKYINENIGYCEIIDFYPNTCPPAPYKGVVGILRRIKASLPLKENRLRKKRQSFQDNHYILSATKYYGDTALKQSPPQYDVIISGSDQILNLTLGAGSESYYLTFTENAKKISYASSFGRETVTERELRFIDNELVKFQALSVREASAAEIIQKRIGITPTQVLDPVFLLSASEWQALEKKRKHSKPYIFVYVMEDTEVLAKTVAALKEKLNCAVITVYGCSKNGKKSTPEEFISYIRNAEAVVTNSFHGVAFSLLFEKNLFCVAHSTRNTRLESLLNLIGEQDKLIYAEKDIDISKNIIIGTSCAEKLEPYKKNSKKYLKDQLS